MRGPPSTPATCWRGCRANPPRPATSRAACRAWRSCSRRGGPRTTPSSATIDGRVEFGKDYKAKRRVLVVPEQVGDEQPTPREYLVPEGQARLGAGRRLREGRRPAGRRPARAARHPARARRGGAGELPRQRDPGRLPAAGREDQRQAHRGHRPPDVAEGGDPRSGRHDLPDRGAGGPHRVRHRERQAHRGEGAAGAGASRCCRASPRPACRPTPSFRRRRSRRRRGCSPRRPFRARWTASRASRRTSSSGG